MVIFYWLKAILGPHTYMNISYQCMYMQTSCQHKEVVGKTKIKTNKIYDCEMPFNIDQSKPNKHNL
jgi:hypothetical protein